MTRVQTWLMELVEWLLATLPMMVFLAVFLWACALGVPPLVAIVGFSAIHGGIRLYLAERQARFEEGA